MITDSNGMKQIEKESGFSVFDLMVKAGQAVCAQAEKDLGEEDHVLIIAGNGNNGGDGYVIAKYLPRPCRVFAPLGMPKTDAAKQARKLLKRGQIVKKSDFEEALKEADVVIDCVFGFGYHGRLPEEIRPVFRMIRKMKKRVLSVDINSGCEADTGACDNDALVSDITYALDCFKPFHVMRKDHHMFKEAVIVPLGLPHPASLALPEMDEEEFFRSFPKKKDNAHKTSEGRILIAGGGTGMAGALILNLIGARTMGASYIDVMIPENIYEITASKIITAVYHPFGWHTMEPVAEPLIENAKVIAFGSGAVNFPKNREFLDLALQNSTVPVILDAEALRIMVHNTYLFRFVRCPVILTPHIGEFSALIGRQVHETIDEKIALAKKFAVENDVYLVLKGPHTTVFSPAGDMYINQSGNEALAQAGSGDLLTGIMAACLAVNNDIFKAICMAVFIHGHIADIGLAEMSVRGFDLEAYPRIMDQLFRKHAL